jgi:hypothetical protein
MITVGADPEFFLKKGDMNVSAHGIVPGDKRTPHPLGSGAVQLDGTAVEFNIKPAKSADEFASNISAVLTELRTFIPTDYMFQFTPSVQYDKHYFDQFVPQSCKELGCDPDFSAYTSKENPKPNTKGGTLRTGAGHLHIGWGDGLTGTSHMWDCCQIVQALDNYFRYYEKIWDRDVTRRTLYGKPGAFRPKSYGVEYRVLSNAWLNHPKMWPWLFNSAEFVFNKMVNGETTRHVVGVRDQLNLDAINKAVVKSMGKDAPLLTQDMLS